MIASTQEVARLLEPDEYASRSVVLAATFSIEPIERPLRFWVETLALPLDVVLAPYGQLMQQLLDPDSACSRNSDGFNVLLIRPEDCIRDLTPKDDLLAYVDHFDRTLSEWVHGIKTLSTRSSAFTFIFVCPPSPGLSEGDARFLGTLGDSLMRQVSEAPGVLCLRHPDVVALYPVAALYDRLSDRIAHIPYSSEYYTAVATVIIRRTVRLLSTPHKVIVLDCDNTLWTGICGESTPADLQLTNNHVTLQKMLVGLQEAGVLLCLCSKNNVADVEDVFDARTDMPLRLDHIVSRRINWELKSDNIKSLATELNLGLDSFIFIDDSPAECAEVQAACPEVLTLQLPSKPQELNRFLMHTWALDTPAATADARKRNARYKENRRRETAMAEATDIAAFLAGIELNVQVTAPEPAHMGRVAELIVRTNQFNLTTIRYSPGDLDTLTREPNVHLRVVHVRDRFGDYGLTGVLVLRVSEAVALVDTFLLSCRVLGRRVELSVLNQIGSWASERGIKYLRFEYRRTPRNTPALTFLKQALGEFEEADAEGGTYTVPVSYAMGRTFEPCVGSRVQQTGIDSAEEIRNSVDLPRWYRAGETQSLSRVGDILAAVNRLSTRLDVRAGERAPSEHPPRGALEESLAQIWSETLAIPFVSRDWGFLEAGGESVDVVKLISRIAERFAVQLSIAAILRCRSLAEMARLIATLQVRADETDNADLEAGAI